MDPRNWSGWTKVAALLIVVAVGGTLWAWSADEVGGGRERAGDPLLLEPGVLPGPGSGVRPGNFPGGAPRRDAGTRAALPSNARSSDKDGLLAGQLVRGAGGGCNVGESGGGPRPMTPHVGIWNDRVAIFELDENACPRPVEITSWRTKELPRFQRNELARGIPFRTNEERYLILEGLEPHS